MSAISILPNQGMGRDMAPERQVAASGSIPASHVGGAASQPPVEIDGGAVMNRDDVEAAVSEIQQHLDFMQTKLAFKVDKQSEEMVVEVMDRETGEVLKQVPPEELLKIRMAFKELVRGVLLNAEA